MNQNQPDGTKRQDMSSKMDKTAAYTLLSSPFRKDHSSPSPTHPLEEPTLISPDDSIVESRQASLSLNKHVPQYTSEASILLTGVRGAGKTTLAVMAASVLNRKVIDIDSAFNTALGSSSSEYKANYGLEQYHKKQTQFLQTILDRYHNSCILVCSWMDCQVQLLYRDFARHHPVIHVMRDPEAIAKLFNIADKSKIRQMLHVSRAIWRTCTNFEFFNISEKKAPSSPSPEFTHRPRATLPSLTLKHAESHFFRFLARVYPGNTFSVMEPTCPLANVPIEDRRYTYAVSLPLSDVLDERFDLAQHVVGSDAVQILVQDLDRYGQTDSETSCADLGYDIARATAKIRRSMSFPLLLHVVLSDVDSEHTVKLYLELLQQCLRLAPDMMTVDLRLNDGEICDIVASRQQTMLIGSYSVDMPLSWNSPIWLTMYTKANRLGCDFARFVCPVSSTEDISSVTHLRCRVAEMKDAKTRLIAYNSGILGRSSAVFNQILTEVRSKVLDYRENIPKPSLAPSITAFEATRALFSSFTQSGFKFYVFGRDVDYSLSPAMLIPAFKACGIPHQYQPISTSTLQDIQTLIDDELFGGATVTTPFKIEALSLTQSVSKHARAIGALNTLIPFRRLEQDGSLPTGAQVFHQMNQPGPIKAVYGENTDWIGIGACIQHGLSPANAVTPNTCGLILGAGGMARAAVYAMLQLGIRNIVIYNRTFRNAEKVVSHFTELTQQGDFEACTSISSVRFFILPTMGDPWPDAFRFPVAIVSCIPVDAPTDSSSWPFVIPKEYFSNPTGGVAIDLGYKIPNTPLVVQAQRNAGPGWVIMDWLDVLPQQGFAQFELFTGRRAPYCIMQREVRRLSCR